MFFQPEPALTWTIFGVVWLVCLSWEVYKKGRRSGAEQEKLRVLAVAGGARDEMAKTLPADVIAGVETLISIIRTV